ncbi:MAG TPA: diacylglycerol kinase family protein [Acidimicrobiia bacterium]
MRLLLIVNPTASSMTPRRRVLVQHALSDAHRLEVAETTQRNDATHLAREAAAEGFDVVVVAAGDGTLNEAANGLVGTDTALAPLPGGSTNVFGRTLGVPNALRPATEQLVASLDAGSTRRVGLGSGNDRRFLFHLGAGFDAEVIDQMERHAWLKRRLAHPTFAVAAITTFYRGFDRAHAPFRVEVGGEPLTDGYYAIVSNTTPYAFFGVRPLTVTHAAGLERKLALTAFRRLTSRGLVAAAFSAMGRGRHLAHAKDVVLLADLDSVTLTATDAPFPWQVDGDYLGELEQLEIRYEPDCLTLVTPVR